MESIDKITVTEVDQTVYSLLLESKVGIRKVQRSLLQFEQLSSSIAQFNPGLSSLIHFSSNKSAVQQFLQMSLASSLENAEVQELLMDFCSSDRDIEVEDPMKRLTDKVESLTASVSAFEQRLVNLEEGYSRTVGLLQQWSLLQQGNNNAAKTSDLVALEAVPPDPPSQRLERLTLVESKLESAAVQSTPSSLSRNIMVEPERMASGSLSGVLEGEVDQPQNRMTFEKEDSVHSSVNSDNLSSSSISNSGGESQIIKKGQLTREVKRKRVVDQLGLQELTSELDRLEKTSLKFADDIRALIRCIQPNEDSARFRSELTEMLRRQVRLSINCSLIDSGLHELGCNLPDDPIRFFVLLSKSHFPTWHTSLCERMSAASERTTADVRDGGNYMAEFNIEDVGYVRDDQSFKVTCLINDQPIEIEANQRHDLCYLAFLEEVSGLVGRDHLLKKSLIIIRAWWRYEVPNLIGRNIQHYIPEMILDLMVVAVFNKHHQRIVSPMQALCMFVMEYCVYDSEIHLITLQGLLSCSHPSGAGPVQLMPPNPRHMINATLLEKYNQLFHLNGASGGLMTEDNGLVFTSQMSAEYNRGSFSQIVNRHQLIHFERIGFNVLNPFTYKQCEMKRMSSRRLAHLTAAFKTGAKVLVATLSEASLGLNPSAFAATGSSAGQEFVKAIFPVTLRKFGRQGNGMRVRSLFEMSIISQYIERLWKNILFCNFVLESVVTESAILTASIESLAIKGPLPVGEVGKMLTDVSCMQQLSLHLKEKFGGLKKFLEKFPDVFVFSNDHPFNPHVILRSDLSSDQQKMVYRGVLPMHIMSVFKKGGHNKRQTMKSSPDYLTTGFAMSSNHSGDRGLVDTPMKPSGRSLGHFGALDATPSKSFIDRPGHANAPFPSTLPGAIAGSLSYSSSVDYCYGGSGNGTTVSMPLPRNQAMTMGSNIAGRDKLVGGALKPNWDSASFAGGNRMQEYDGGWRDEGLNRSTNMGYARSSDRYWTNGNEMGEDMSGLRGSSMIRGEFDQPLGPSSSSYHPFPEQSYGNSVMGGKMRGRGAVDDVQLTGIANDPWVAAPLQPHHALYHQPNPSQLNDSSSQFDYINP